MSESASVEAAWEFCNRILVDVSRSFALIIPRCPPPIDRALCAGYLLCRLADTIEDDELPTPDKRAELYDALLACVDSPDDVTLCMAFVQAWPHIPAGGYGELVRGTELVLRAFRSLPETYRGPLAACVHEMVGGMRSMRVVLERNGVSFYCGDLRELDQYCHYVAGTVGIMSTALFERYLTDKAREDRSSFVASDTWREQGRRMGLGLQMTNIIKDASADAGRGASFIPPEYVEWIDAQPRMTRTGRAELIKHTLKHLDQAIDYTTALPPNQTGIRTFLLGSILPAVATLEIAAAGLRESPKIDRATMSELLSFVEQHASDNKPIREFHEGIRLRCTEILSGAPEGPVDPMAFKDLSHFLGCYFHQDCLLDADSADEIVRTYADQCGDKEELSRLMTQVHQLNVKGSDERTIARILRELGLAYDPCSDGWTYSSWLKHVESLLSKLKT